MGRSRTAKNKSTKTTLSFDEGARTDFLLGFRKRKQERKKKAREQNQRELKEDIRKARLKARTDAAKARDVSASSSNRILPELEHLVPSSVEDYGSHLVSVTHVDSLEACKLASVANGLRDAGDGLSRGGEANASGANSATARTIKKANPKETRKNRFLKKTRQSKTLNRSLSKKQLLKENRSTKTKRAKHHNPKKVAKDHG